MRILYASYYAEAHLASSSAQNTRFLAGSLAEIGHEVSVVCAAERAGVEHVDGYRLKKLPISSRSWPSTRLGAWRPDSRIRDAAREELELWRPDVVVSGAFKFLTEFVLEAHRHGVPAVQIVHDYSLICLRQWLIDSSGRLCTGPTSEAKCLRCMRRGMGLRERLKNQLVSLPPVFWLARKLFGSARRDPRPTRIIVGEALAHMAAYRDAVTLFVAQAPSVVDLLGSAGISPTRCRFLPQFVGDEKLRPYPRPVERPGTERPIRVIYVGRWSKEKGPDLLLDAFRTVASSSDLELWLISRNARRSEIERVELTRGGSRSVRVFSDLEGAQVSRRLAQCDVCVVPSRCHELASRVVLEANAQGVPVIASSTVGNSYLIEDGVNGRVFPSGDGAALRECLEELIETPAQIQSWSRQVSKPVRRRPWIGQAVAILEEAASRRSAGS